MTSPSFFAGKTMLVTGGTGTIGSAIVERLLDTDAQGIRIFSRDEHKQFELRRRLPDDERLRFFIGDTRDLHRVRRAMEGCAYVFHAAAMKHVYACEYNPFEAVQTNIIGTQNVIDAALEHRVERMLFASSDKAVNPSSTMGASKLMAEKLVTAADTFRGSHPTIFMSVRFGNVIGSRGSVLPLFLEQIAQGGPLTLTDRRMTRYIMSTEHAIALMFKSLELAKGGEVFVLKMPAIRIEDLAAVLRERLSPPVDIEEIGAQAGEKFSEELVSEDERDRCLETEDLFIVLPRIASLHPGEAYTYAGAEAATTPARSDAVATLTTDELAQLLVETNVLPGS
jgi:UDP-N-acetylglucosamine 4,6-dehydratase